jgi:hypothetical protein
VSARQAKADYHLRSGRPAPSRLRPSWGSTRTQPGSSRGRVRRRPCPGDVITLLAWHDQAAADAFRQSARLAEGARLRQVRIVRDYGMYDRRENPQYYPEVPQVD